MVANRLIDALLQQGEAAAQLRIYMRNEFEREINEAMLGELMPRTIALSTEAMTQRLFGCSTKDLYLRLKGTQGTRNTLPAAVQNVIFAAESHAAANLSATTVTGSAFERSDRVVEISEESAGRVRRFLPW